MLIRAAWRRRAAINPSHPSGRWALLGSLFAVTTFLLIAPIYQQDLVVSLLKAAGIHAPWLGKTTSSMTALWASAFVSMLLFPSLLCSFKAVLRAPRVGGTCGGPKASGPKARRADLIRSTSTRSGGRAIKYDLL
jgi:hypothetical protein